jgi:hypothetical protein
MSAVDLGAGWLQKPGWTTKRTTEKRVEARATSRVIGQLKDGLRRLPRVGREGREN